MGKNGSSPPIPGDANLAGREYYVLRPYVDISAQVAADCAYLRRAGSRRLRCSRRVHRGVCLARGRDAESEVAAGLRHLIPCLFSHRTAGCGDIADCRRRKEEEGQGGSFGASERGMFSHVRRLSARRYLRVRGSVRPELAHETKGPTRRQSQRPDRSRLVLSSRRLK